MDAAPNNMPHPRTYLLCAPDDADPFGEGMHSRDLVRGLQQINSRFRIPDALDQWNHTRWKEFGTGITTLWYGEPHQEGSKMICALRLGMIPEYTQLDPSGWLITKGWRAILSKIVRGRFASKRAIERVFKIRLEHEGNDKFCNRCRADGNTTSRATNASGLCDFHEGIESQLRDRAKARAEAKELVNGTHHD